MKRLTLPLGLLLGLIFVGAGCATTTSTNTKAVVTNTGDTTTTSSSDAGDQAATVETAGSYVAYDADSVRQAATAGSAILFFHAGWCPTCKALDSNIRANTAAIPAGVTIFQTNYDTQTALKKQYGVTYQHTLVQVDANGNMLAKWSGGNTLESVISHIQ